MRSRWHASCTALPDDRPEAAPRGVRGARQRPRRHAVPGHCRRRAGRVHRLPLPAPPQPRHVRGLGQRPVRARAVPRPGHRARAAGRRDRRVAAARRPPGHARGRLRARRGARPVRGSRFREPGKVLRDRAGHHPVDRARGRRRGSADRRRRRGLRGHHAAPGRARPAGAERGDAAGAAADRTRSTSGVPTPDPCWRRSTARPVGFISLEFRQPFFTTAPQAWIPDLVVTESARGRDIGAALLDAAFAEAVRRGAYAGGARVRPPSPGGAPAVHGGRHGGRRQLLHARSLSGGCPTSPVGTESAVDWVPGAADRSPYCSTRELGGNYEHHCVDRGRRHCRLDCEQGRSR